jgi:hypothetical protein
MSLSGSKTHPLWYAHVGREAKKEIVGIIHSGQEAKRASRPQRQGSAMNGPTEYGGPP